MDTPEPAVELEDDEEDSGGAPPAEKTPSEGKGFESLVDRLWEEYKLIQQKIDQIGDYQFKVKSWSATLLAAGLFSGKATESVALWICAFLIAGIFHLSERRQRVISQRLGWRALAIERAFRDLPPISDRNKWARIRRRIPGLHSVPGIASIIMREPPMRSKLEGADVGAVPKNRVQRTKAWAVRSWQWLTNNSDDGFYIAQYLALGVVAAAAIYHFLLSCLKH